MNLDEDKKRLRNKLKQSRAAISANQLAKLSEQISVFLHEIDAFTQAKTLFCYVSYLNEVDTHPLIDYCLRHEKAIFVPKIIGKTKMIAVEVANMSELVPDKMGILTPQSNQAHTGPFDIAITPGLGFTANGERLGYGRGYYDRWFATHQTGLKIGIAFECQIVAELPTDKTDIPVDIIVTDERVIHIKH